MLSIGLPSASVAVIDEDDLFPFLRSEFQERLPIRSLAIPLTSLNSLFRTASSSTAIPSSVLATPFPFTPATVVVSSVFPSPSVQSSSSSSLFLDSLNLDLVVLNQQTSHPPGTSPDFVRDCIAPLLNHQCRGDVPLHLYRRPLVTILLVKCEEIDLVKSEYAHKLPTVC